MPTIIAFRRANAPVFLTLLIYLFAYLTFVITTALTCGLGRLRYPFLSRMSPITKKGV